VAKHWSQLAACKDEDPELFFPVDPRRNKQYTAQVEVAKAVCRGCPVSQECFLFAMEHKAEGIWGGTTDDDRAYFRQEGMLTA
jgi:WhiB family redox-sensing transcriptional regulator